MFEYKKTVLPVNFIQYNNNSWLKYTVLMAVCMYIIVSICWMGVICQRMKNLFVFNTKTATFGSKHKSMFTSVTTLPVISFVIFRFHYMNWLFHFHTVRSFKLMNVFN